MRPPQALLKLGRNAQVAHYEHQWLPLAAGDVPAGASRMGARRSVCSGLPEHGCACKKA